MNANAAIAPSGSGVALSSVTFGITSFIGSASYIALSTYVLTSFDGSFKSSNSTASQ
jgi:hypothetical protein